MRKTTVHTQKIMRGLVLLCLSLFLCSNALVLPSQVLAAGRQDFTLKNRLGRTIYHVYISRHEDNEWGSDILGASEVLDSGDDDDITFDEDEGARYWDLKVVDQYGNKFEWDDLNLPEIHTITLHFVDGQAYATKS